MEDILKWCQWLLFNFQCLEIRRTQVVRIKTLLIDNPHWQFRSRVASSVFLWFFYSSPLMFIDSHSFNQFGRLSSLSSSSTLKLINKNQWSDSWRMKLLLNENTKMQFFCYKLANFPFTFVAIKGNGFPSVHCDKFIVKLVSFRQSGISGGTWQSHKLLHLFIVSSDILALAIRGGDMNKKSRRKYLAHI